MAKWADYLISAVNYDSKHMIYQVLQHSDDGNKIGEGVVVNRETILSNIDKGKSYVTIYNGIKSWKLGYPVRKFKMQGKSYLRIDENKSPLDSLGDLPEIGVEEKAQTS